jgi:hypothetical protein
MNHYTTTNMAGIKKSIKKDPTPGGLPRKIQATGATTGFVVRPIQTNQSF